MPTVSRPKVNLEGPVAPEAPAAAPSGTVAVQDSKGRTLVFRKLTTLQNLDLIESLGANVVENVAAMAHYMIGAMLVSIEGEPVDPGQSKKDLRFRIQQLGDEGLLAAGEAVDTLMNGLLGNKEAVEATAKK